MSGKEDERRVDVRRKFVLKFWCKKWECFIIQSSIIVVGWSKKINRRIEQKTYLKVGWIWKLEDLQRVTTKKHYRFQTSSHLS